MGARQRGGAAVARDPTLGGRQNHSKFGTTGGGGVVSEFAAVGAGDAVADEEAEAGFGDVFFAGESLPEAAEVQDLVGGESVALIFDCYVGFAVVVGAGGYGDEAGGGREFDGIVEEIAEEGAQPVAIAFDGD